MWRPTEKRTNRLAPMRAAPPPPPPCTPKGVGVQRPRRARPRDQGGDRQCPHILAGASLGQISEPDLSPKKICVSFLARSLCSRMKRRRWKKKSSAQREGEETAAHTRQACCVEKRATRHRHQRRFCRVAQQVIRITTCSQGSFSLIYFPSTYPS